MTRTILPGFSSPAASGLAAIVLLAGTLGLAGCSGAELVLKIPVSAGCKEIPLKECDELTDGLILYVEGKKEEGKPHVAKAVSANSPTELRRFAAFLQSIRGVAGAEEYMQPVFEVAEFIHFAATNAEAAQAAQQGQPLGPPPGQFGQPPIAGPPGAPSPTVSPPAPPAAAAASGVTRMLTADTDPKQIDGGAVAPLTSPGRGPCGPMLGSAATTCARAVDGPFVVTDVLMSAECDASVFVAATSPNGLGTSARWAVMGSTRSVTGGRLLVRKDETLIIGAPEAKKADQRCVVTWAGFRPYSEP